MLASDQHLYVSPAIEVYGHCRWLLPWQRVPCRFFVQSRVEPVLLVERCSSKTSIRRTRGPPPFVVWLLLLLAIGLDAPYVGWSDNGIFLWFVESDVSQIYYSGIISDWSFQGFPPLYCDWLDRSLASILLIGWKLNVSSKKRGYDSFRLCLHNRCVCHRVIRLLLFSHVNGANFILNCHFTPATVISRQYFCPLLRGLLFLDLILIIWSLLYFCI